MENVTRISLQVLITARTKHFGEWKFIETEQCIANVWTALEKKLYIKSASCLCPLSVFGL